MTDPTPAAAADPTATAVPAPVAPKKGKKTLVIIVAVVVGSVAFLITKLFVGGLLSGLSHRATADDFQVGKCVDQYSTSATAQSTAVPNVVDCSKSSAKAKIVGVYDGKAAANAESSCPASADYYLQLNKSAGGTVLVCLAGL